VLNDLDLLDCLPPRDKIAGMAEAVKVALIRDAAFFRWLERQCRRARHLRAGCHGLDDPPLRRAAHAPDRHGGDPFETGSARPLDFGHWSAHKLEGMTRHHLRHGEAVAIGIALDARYSVLAGLLPAGCRRAHRALLEHLGFRLWHPAARDDRRPGRSRSSRACASSRSIWAASSRSRCSRASAAASRCTRWTPAW
jgi:3-dehydroquinate synthase